MKVTVGAGSKQAVSIIKIQNKHKDTNNGYTFGGVRKCMLCGRGDIYWSGLGQKPLNYQGSKMIID